MKKSLCRVLVTALVVGAMSTGVFAAVPADVEGQNYEQAVTALMEKGIITGDVDGSFHPDERLTRAQACVIVVKAMNPEPAEVTGTATQRVPASGFSDMEGYRWADGYVSYAVKTGVAKGYPEGTFKPGGEVTVNELVTMVLRAAGVTDESLGGTWPGNYVGKANEFGLLNSLPAERPQEATKWMAAEVTYGALSKIEAAHVQQEEVTTEKEETEDKDKNTSNSEKEEVATNGKMTYVSGSFDSPIATYNKMKITAATKIYAYGVEKDYKDSFKLPKDFSEMKEENIYRYKSVKTPAFYELDGDRIVSMVVPGDVGYSGKAYVVINGAGAALDGTGAKASSLKTLTATKEIIWLGSTNLTLPAKSEYLAGELYELNLSRGEIKNIATVTDSYKGKVFEELSGKGFVKVTDYEKGLLTLDGGKMVTVKDNASVYVLEEGKSTTEYKSGRLSDLKAGVKVRAYDVLDDKETSANVIIIKK